MEYAYNAETKSLTSVLYAAEQRLSIVREMRTRRLEPLYREFLAHPVLLNVLMFNPEGVEHRDYSYFEGRQGPSDYRNLPEKGMTENKDRILAQYERILEGLRANAFDSLNASIAAIGGGSRNDEIRQLSRQYLAESEK